jgi:hypothetical protein
MLNMFRFNISQPICLVPSSIHPPTHAISLYVYIYIRICINIAYPKQLAAHVGNETAL